MTRIKIWSHVAFGKAVVCYCACKSTESDGLIKLPQCWCWLDNKLACWSLTQVSLDERHTAIATYLQPIPNHQSTPNMLVPGMWEEARGETTQAQGEHPTSARRGPSWPAGSSSEPSSCAATQEPALCCPKLTNSKVKKKKNLLSIYKHL